MAKHWLEAIEGVRLYQALRYSMNRKLVAFFKTHVLAGRQNLQVAEVACGSGVAAHLLASESNVSLSVAGDINLDDFKQADVKQYRASFVLMDIFKPATRSESLDLVWNSSSIEEIDGPEAAVAAMASMVKSGGFVFVGVPYKFGVAGLIKLLPNRKTKAWIGRTYDADGVVKLLAEAGLKEQARLYYLGGTFIGVLGRKN